MSNVSQSQRKFLECTSRFRIHGHGRRLGAENQDPNFGPGNRSLYRRTEDKRPIFKFSPRGLFRSDKLVSLRSKPSLFHSSLENQQSVVFGTGVMAAS